MNDIFHLKVTQIGAMNFFQLLKLLMIPFHVIG